MSVLTREDLMEQIKSRVGDNTDDETLKFIEDITDTINDLETKANNDNEDWKTKYEENDKAWREKYRERFFSGSKEDDDNGGDNGGDDNDDKPTPKTFDELFN